MKLEKLTHCGTIKLETERLLLRRFKRGDAQAMFDNWASDPEVAAYITWPPAKSVADVMQTLDNWIGDYAKPDYYQWAITIKGSDEPIGSIGAVDKNDGIRMVHIGYCIGRPWQNKGYMTEALSFLIRFFIDDIHYNRVEARHDPRNVASGRVMQKAGMAFEGIKRQADWNNQGLCDSAMYAILKADLRG